MKALKTRRKMWLRLVVSGTVLLGALIVAAGCARNIPASDFCLIYRPPMLTEQEWKTMSDQSERMILDNIVVYDRLCK